MDKLSKKTFYPYKKNQHYIFYTIVYFVDKYKSMTPTDAKSYIFFSKLLFQPKKNIIWIGYVVNEKKLLE